MLWSKDDGTNVWNFGLEYSDITYNSISYGGLRRNYFQISCPDTRKIQESSESGFYRWSYEMPQGIRFAGLSHVPVGKIRFLSYAASGLGRDGIWNLSCQYYDPNSKESGSLDAMMPSGEGCNPTNSCMVSNYSVGIPLTTCSSLCQY